MLRLIPTTKRRNKSEEGDHQVAFFKWLKLAKPHANSLTFAVPNGGKRDIKEAIALKMRGLKAGVCDVFMAIPTEEYSGLFIEFKAGRNKLTGPQQTFVALAREVGYRVDVCYSWIEAKDIVLDYLKDYDYAAR